MKPLFTKYIYILLLLGIFTSCSTRKQLGSRYLCHKYETEESVDIVQVSPIAMLLAKPWIAFFAKDLQPIAKQISSIKILDYSPKGTNSLYGEITSDIETAFRAPYYEKMANINSNGDKIEILAHSKERKKSTKIKEVILIAQNKEDNSIMVLSLKGNNINVSKIFQQYLKKE